MKISKKKIKRFIHAYKYLLILATVILVIAISIPIIYVSATKTNRIVVDNLSNGNKIEITKAADIRELEKILTVNKNGAIEDTFENLSYRLHFYHNDTQKYIVILYENKNSYWINKKDSTYGAIGFTDNLQRVIEIINNG